MTTGDDWIPHLAIVKDAILSPDNPGDIRSMAMALEQLPYSLRGAHQAAVNLITKAQAIASAHEHEVHPGPLALGVSRTEQDSLGFEIDHFLDFAVRAQNALIPYVSLALRRSVPPSLRRLVENPPTGSHALPEVLTYELISYWNFHGARVRAYRDLGQHYALVSSEVCLLRASTGEMGISLTLPNNPEAKSARDLKFTDPIVLAIPYVAEQLVKLFAISHRVTALFIPEDTDLSREPEIWVFRDPSLAYAQSAHKIPTLEMLKSELDRCLERQEAWYASLLAEPPEESSTDHK